MIRRWFIARINDLLFERSHYDEFLLTYPQDTFGYAKGRLAVAIIDLKISIIRSLYGRELAEAKQKLSGDNSELSVEE